MNSPLKLLLLAPVIAALPASVAQAQWLEKTGGPYDYGDSSRWSDGAINGAFSGAYTGPQTITFSENRVLGADGSGNALSFTFTGPNKDHDLTFAAAPDEAPVLTLEGNIYSGNNNIRVITLGTAANPFTIDLGDATRTIRAGSNTTFNVYAHIQGDGVSLNVAEPGSSGAVAFRNDTNSFTGDFALYGTTLYTSLADAGQASALGAGSAISVNGQLQYIGNGDSTSNRAIHIGTNATISLSGSEGTGNVTFTGTMTGENTGEDRTLNFVNAVSRNITATGAILNPTDGHLLSVNKNGLGTLRLLATDSDYAGTTTVQVSTLEFSSIANLGEKSSLGAPVTVENGTILLGSSSNAVLSYVGAGDSVSNRRINLRGSATSQSIAVNGSGSMMLTGEILSSDTARTLKLDGNGTGLGTISGTISDAGPSAATSLQKAGLGTWLLSGENSYTGKTTLVNNSGVLMFTSIANAGTNSALGADGVIQINPRAYLKYVGTSDSATDRTVELAANTASAVMTIDASGTGALKLANITAISNYGKTLVLTGSSTAANAVTGAIGQTSTSYRTAVLKAGGGDWTLSGANSYTGTTSVYDGKLILDFSAGGAPLANIVHTDSALQLSGGALEIKGAAGGGSSQTFASTAINFGHSTVSVSGGGGTVDLKALTRAGGGSVDFRLPGSGSIRTSTTTMTNGVLSDGGVAYASVNDGADWATVEDGAIAALTNYQTSLDPTAWGTADNVSVGTQVTGVTTRTINTLKLHDGGAVSIGSGETLTLGASGLLVSGGGSYSISGGSLKGATSKNLVILQSNAASRLEISSNIANASYTSLVKSGPGTLALTGLNSYSAPTYINGGVLEVNMLADGGKASNIGASGSGAGLLIFNGGTLRYVGGEASTDRNFSVDVNGATLDASGTGALKFTGTGTIDFRDTYNGPLRTLTLTGSNTGHNELNLVLANSGAGAVTAPTSLIKNGSGTWVLGSDNTYTGATTIEGGTLLVNGSLASGGVVAVQTGGTLGGRGSVGSVRVDSGASIAPGDGVGRLEAGSTTLAGGAHFALELNAGEGAAGVNWDQLSVTGSVVLSSLESGSPLVIDLFTIDAGGNRGLLESWDGSGNVIWTSFLTASDGFVGEFDASHFVINTDGFLNSFDGSFSVVRNGSNLDLVYSIPEPGAYGAFATGCLTLVGLLRRRRNGEASDRAA